MGVILNEHKFVTASEPQNEDQVLAYDGKSLPKSTDLMVLG